MIMEDRVAPFLPEEIIRNILKRLPVKSLMRFQCVCKHWKNLFKCPSFIADHFHHSSHQNPLLLLQPEREGQYISHLYLLDREMQVHDLSNLFDAMRIIGSCNGLLCVEIDVQGIHPPLLFLLNPATGDVIMLPRTVDDFECECRLGFGFSPVVNDYKIVRTYAEHKDSIYQVEVYSLSTRSWKEVEFDYMAGTRFVNDAITANGSMFWIGLLEDWEMGGDDIEVVVSFDIALELFEFVPIPALGNNAMFHMMVYEDKLAIHSLVRDADPGCIFDLWVMEENIGASCGERRSWTKIFSSTCSAVGLFIPFPSIFWGDELVYNIHELPGLDDETKSEAENGARTVLYLLNISTNKFKIFNTRKCSTWPARIFNYAQSLVPVSKIPIEEPSS